MNSNSIQDYVTRRVLLYLKQHYDEVLKQRDDELEELEYLRMWKRENSCGTCEEVIAQNERLRCARCRCRLHSHSFCYKTFYDYYCYICYDIEMQQMIKEERRRHDYEKVRNENE